MNAQPWNHNGFSESSGQGSPFQQQPEGNFSYGFPQQQPLRPVSETQRIQRLLSGIAEIRNQLNATEARLLSALYHGGGLSAGGNGSSYQTTPHPSFGAAGPLQTARFVGAPPQVPSPTMGSVCSASGRPGSSTQSPFMNPNTFRVWTAPEAEPTPAPKESPAHSEEDAATTADEKTAENETVNLPEENVPTQSTTGAKIPLEGAALENTIKRLRDHINKAKIRGVPLMSPNDLQEAAKAVAELEVIGDVGTQLGLPKGISFTCFAEELVRRGKHVDY